MKARPYIGRILMKSVFRYFQGSGNMALMLPILPNLQDVHQPRIGLEENGPELFVGQLRLQLMDPIEQLNQLYECPCVMREELPERIVVQLSAHI